MYLKIIVFARLKLEYSGKYIKRRIPARHNAYMRKEIIKKAHLPRQFGRSTTQGVAHTKLEARQTRLHP
jgi:hypothetical protein